MKANFLKNLESASKAGKGGWNDPDMLQVGNGLLSADEEATHFALWAFAKAPLLIGCDLSTISTESLEVLTNDEMIRINQDSLGNQATEFTSLAKGPLKAYSANVLLEDDSAWLAILWVNWSDSDVSDAIQLLPFEAGIANSPNDWCDYWDLMTGEYSRQRASAFANYPALAVHASYAIRVRCLPF